MIKTNLKNSFTKETKDTRKKQREILELKNTDVNMKLQ